MSRFAIDLDTLRARLKRTRVSEISRAAVLDYLEGADEDEVALWIDEPWGEVEFDELASDALVACVVITEPLEMHGLEPRDERLLGYHQARDGAAWVFLKEARCSVFTTLPDALCVFGGGLVVEGIACFAAPDAHSLVEKRLEADVVLSGMGDAAVSIVPGTSLSIRAFHSYLSCAAPLSEIVSEEMAERLEDEAGWEVVSDLLDEGE